MKYFFDKRKLGRLGGGLNGEEQEGFVGVETRKWEASTSYSFQWKGAVEAKTRRLREGSSDYRASEESYQE